MVRTSKEEIQTMYQAALENPKCKVLRSHVFPHLMGFGSHVVPTATAEGPGAAHGWRAMGKTRNVAAVTLEGDGCRLSIAGTNLLRQGLAQRSPHGAP